MLSALQVARLVGAVVLAVVSAPVALVLVAATYSGLRQISNHVRYRRSGCKIPRVPEKPIIGSLKLVEPHVAELENRKLYGRIFVTFRVTQELYMVADPDLVAHILQKDNYPKSDIYVRVAEYWGPSVITFQHGEGNPWKATRNLLDPAFRAASLRALSSTFAQHAVHFTEKMLAFAEQHGQGTTIEFVHEANRVALEVISEAAFGYNLEAMGSEADAFLGALQGVLHGISTPLLFFPFGGHVARFKHRHEFAIVNKVFYQVIDQRLEELKSGRLGQRANRDLLDLMIAPDAEALASAVDGKTHLSREELRNELAIFYFAGHETTANTVNWTMFELGRNPLVMETLLQEIDSVMGPYEEAQRREGNSGSKHGVIAPTHVEIDQMPYLDMVLNESLRLYPPLMGVGRRNPEAFEFKGHIFPKGVTVSASMFLIQRDPEFWPDPLKFDPERFTKENSVGRHPYAFFPFSSGPRICIGRRFFYHEAKTLLVTLLRHAAFVLDETKVSGKQSTKSGILKPTEVWLKVSKREDAH